jgi:glycosyltransferase involved in cell wall biosynthesis
MLAPFGIRPKGTLAVRMLPLARALARRGHHVRITAPPVHNPQDAGQRQVFEGVTVFHTPLPRLPGPAGVGEQVGLLLHHALAGAPDILHLFKPKGYSGLAALAARAIRPWLPLVMDTDDWEGWGGWNDLLPYPAPARRLFAWQERDLSRRAASVTVASRTLETQVWGFGVRPERVIYLPNGVEGGSSGGQEGERWSAPSSSSAPSAPSAPSGRSVPSSSSTLLLYTRFWEFEVWQVVAALVAIVQKRPEVRLLVVGKGEQGEEHELLRLAQRAGVAPAVDYRGWVEPAHIPLLLASANAAIVPMDDTLINRARCSVKLLELMAAGLPIVAGRVGQVAEYLDDERSGLLVPPGDPAALAQAALRLLNDDDGSLRERLGKAARERAIRDFSWDRLVGEAERAYIIAMGLR